MNLEREIVGSVDYIRKNLAPPGKAVQIMLWSGDAAPQAQALRIAENAGLLNMNGGNTIITRSFPEPDRRFPARLCASTASSRPSPR
jgi:hypothetical protein